MEKKTVSTVNDANIVLENINNILSNEFNDYKDVCLIITESLFKANKHKVKELQRVFQGIKLHCMNNVSSTLQIICDESEQYKCFVISSECLREGDNGYEMNSFINGYAAALNVKVIVV